MSEATNNKEWQDIVTAATAANPYSDDRTASDEERARESAYGLYCMDSRDWEPMSWTTLEGLTDGAMQHADIEWKDYI
jgi:hypothetical protein